MDQKRIIVTGVNGFLGGAIARQLANHYAVFGIGTAPQDDDFAAGHYTSLRMPDDELFYLVRQINPDAFVHCAGGASVQASFEDPERDFQNGPVLTLHVLEALRRANSSATLIFPSSAAVYGNPKQLPIRETDLLQPISPYGCHKEISETLILDYARLYKIHYLILRIFSCYGPGLKKQLLWDACNKIWDGDFEFYGTGEETRDFVYVSDVSDFIVTMLDDRLSGSIVNIANGCQITIKDIVHQIISLAKKTATPCFKGLARNGDPLHWEASIDLAGSLGFKPHVSFAEGIGNYYRWFCAAQESSKGGSYVN
jgi:UDP-glucose 4-epimerase